MTEEEELYEKARKLQAQLELFMNRPTLTLQEAATRDNLLFQMASCNINLLTLRIVKLEKRVRELENARKDQA